MTEKFDRFKFRIWDVSRKKYRTSQNSWLVDILIDSESGLVTHGEANEVYGFEEENSVILEQCTGIKDKNDKLIYENDIILFENKKYIIKWNDYGWYLCKEEKDIEEMSFLAQLFKEMEDPFLEKAEPINISLNSWRGKEVEIIGNIHQQLK